MVKPGEQSVQKVLVLQARQLVGQVAQVPPEVRYIFPEHSMHSEADVHERQPAVQAVQALVLR
jgi:hypothetical protein